MTRKNTVSGTCYAEYYFDEYCGVTLCASGEKGPADNGCQRGQAVEGSQRSAEGPGGSGGGAGSHAAGDEPDRPESEEPDWAEDGGANSAPCQLREGELRTKNLNIKQTGICPADANTNTYKNCWFWAVFGAVCTVCTVATKLEAHY